MWRQARLFRLNEPRGTVPLSGVEREEAIQIIQAHHYLGSVPSGKSYYFEFEECIVVFSLPANYHIARFLLGEGAQNGDVWELSRLWAPDGHGRNLLTRALSRAIRGFRQCEGRVRALVAYADPNLGHHGGVYQAASWMYCGRCEEARLYRALDGTVIARRAFHSGGRHLNKAEIEAMGYTEERAAGKVRWVKGLTRSSRRSIRRRFGDESVGAVQG